MKGYVELHDDQEPVALPRPTRRYGRQIGALAMLLAAAGVGTLAIVTDSQALDAPTRLLTTTTRSLLEAATGTCPAIETGVDYVGNDIGAVLGSGAADCCTKCALHAGCGAFTWSNYDGGTCWLKSGKTGTVAKAGAVSGVLVPVAPPAIAATCGAPQTNVDFLGNDIGNVPGSGADFCCAMCLQRVGCGAYSWSNYLGGTCWLKSGKGATTNTAGVVSAVVTASSVPAPTTCAAIETGVDYVGNDIGNVPGTGATDCCAKCGQRVGCGAFTWSNHNGGTCWLKSNKGAVTNKAGVVSAVIGSSTAPAPAPPPPAPAPAPAPVPPVNAAPVPTTTCPDFYKDIDYDGGDIGKVPGASVYECCDKCRQFGGCGAFTWTSYNGGTCWLKSGRGTMKANVGAISGFVAITLSIPPSAPRPTNLPLGYIYGGLSKAQSDLPSENGVLGNPSAYPTQNCKLPNYISRNNKIYAVGPGGVEEPMSIKGVNWFGMETGATIPLGMWYNEKNGSTAYSIAAFLQRNNFNSVRLPICMESLLSNIVPEKGLFNSTANRAIQTDNYLNMIKSIIKALAYRQISVLIDIHTLTTTDIGMLWYNDKITEARFLQGIDILTQNLCSDAYYNVIGIDLKNEAAWATWGDNSATTDLRAASERIGNRMLGGCPNWLAFVEGISEAHEFTNSFGRKYGFGDWWGAGLAKAKQFPVRLSTANKVVFAPHFYTPAVWPTEAYYGPNFVELSDSELRENVRLMFDIMFGYLATDPSSPAIVLGEFGGLFALDRHPQKTIQRSVRYTVELLMRAGYSGGYVWSLNPESGYDWNPRNERGFSQEGLLLSDWRYANEPMLAAFSPLDAMPDLKPLRCFV